MAFPLRQSNAATWVWVLTCDKIFSQNPAQGAFRQSCLFADKFLTRAAPNPAFTSLHLLNGIAMDKVAEFLGHSMECRKLASKAPTPEVRSHYLNLAAMWERLAEERRTQLESRSR
ncbi:MAG TPA: hypothetical protein VFI23_14220 [Rhizomicrobium sp.]|nr:hypothetical protein [Rhizomicrobium sp.]